MALLKFLNVLTVLSFAVLHTSFDALPVNALTVERGYLGRDLSHLHAEIAKKRSDSSKKCRPRPKNASPNNVVPTNTHVNLAPASKPSPATTTTTTTSSQSAPTYASDSSLSTKIMYAFSNHEQPSLPHFLTGRGKPLIYNWHLQKYSDIDLSKYNCEFVPTAHSKEDVPQAANLKPGYARYIKFLNEPDVHTQANVDPEEAHSLWMQHFEGLTRKGYKLIGPAVTGGGLEWTKTFLSKCDGKCSIYAQDFHAYGIDPKEFQTTLEKYHQLLSSVPVWLTEVGCHDFVGGKTCDQGTFDKYFSGVMEYCKNTPWVEQVAWFGWLKPSEMPQGVEAVNSMITCPTGDNTQCKLNSLGQTFVNY